ncbi:MAG: CopD family protein [Candidatus Korobacteraceae bacterium]
MLKLVDIFGYLSVVLRAGTLVCQSFLLGGVLFLYWIARHNPETPIDPVERVRSSAQRMFRMAAIALVIVQIGYLYVNSAVLMATAEIGIGEVVGANFFIAGTVILVAALAIAIVAGLRLRSAVYWLAPLVLVVLGASVMTNHAAARLDGRAALIIITTLHEAATGFWIGGLPFLLVGLYVAKDRPTQWYLTQRFSRIALISVTVLVLSGFGMSLTYIGSFHALIGTSYGIMVLAKVSMLLALLALGGINFLMLRKYSPDDAMPRLRRLVEAEVGIGITIVLAAASLTSQAPAVDQPNDTVDLPRIMARLEPGWPRMESPQAAELSTKYPGRVIKPLDPSGAPAAYLTDGTPISARVLNDMKWSEYNHHWMGIIVIAMGLLAILARTGHAKWAEYWPLLMIGIAIFIFLRGDPECWPLGPRSFWATWAKPEVFQHRLAALLCIAFAIFELRVRRSPSQGGVLPLIFPLLCAVGAALLLTHSHGTANVQEEFMAEINHAPMAVLGVMAGWSRWLEIRLPAEERTIPSWIWPVCFVLIGAGLLNYREI